MAKREPGGIPGARGAGRTTRVLAPSAALLVVEAAAPGLGDEVQREKRKVLDHYRVATLDWKAATGRNPSLWRPGPIPGTSATDINHPSWETHQMVADALASHWSRAIRRSCRREQAHAGPKLVDANHRDASRAADRWWPSVPLWSVEQLSKFDVCTAPLSVYTTVGGTRVGVPSLSRGWRFFADRPNKYGWIAEEADARINLSSALARRRAFASPTSEAMRRSGGSRSRSRQQDSVR